jgi:hypothetical protein
MALPVINIGSKLDGKGFKLAETASDKLGKRVRSLGKTFAVTFGAAAMLSYSKNAVKAFAENEKSAKRLEMVLKNIGLGFDTAAIEKNLGDISAKFGYEGEVLRESFQKLVTVTGDTAKAQDLLNLSLDVAAGSGADLLTVNQDLAAVYVGNNKGLRKYNLGLTQSELSTLQFNDAVELLTKTFAGAGTAELETYAGKMRVLKEAADNAQEIIGKGLVDALIKLGDDDSADNLAKSMERVAERTADVIRGIGVLNAKIKSIPGFNSDFGVLFDISYLALLEKLGKGDRLKPKPFTTPMTISGSTDAQVKIDKARAAAAAAAAKRDKERLALLKKQAIAEKNKLSLSKAAAVFDTTRISLAAALKATYDKETKLRLEALQAIEEDNGDLALQKISQLAALQKNSELAKLAGIKEISDATLSAINTQLLAELKSINDSKMAEGDKELAREEAFKKYNAAITAAGQLAAKEQYSERVQIQLTEIARLASLSNTTSAANTAALLRESAELSMIDRVAKAQKAADDARLKALQDYAAELGKIGTGGVSGVISGSKGTNATTGGGSVLGGKSAAQLAQEAALLEFFNNEIAARDAAAKALAEAGRGITDPDIMGEVIDSITSGADLASTLEYADAATARADAIATLLNSYSDAAMEALTTNALSNPQYGFQSFQNAEAAALMAGGNGSVGGGIGAYDRDINITVNTGIGDPEAIARAIEDALNQSGYRGTSTNRGSGLYVG